MAEAGRSYKGILKALLSRHKDREDLLIMGPKDFDFFLPEVADRAVPARRARTPQGFSYSLKDTGLK